MPLQWSFYYAATRSGASTPSLYRVFYDGNARGNAQEIIANVESFKLMYGENTMGKDSVTNNACTIATGGATCVPNLQADVWRTTAASVTDWSRVVAVRIGLMMVSADSNAIADLSQVTPTLLGQTYTIPTGASTGRLRKEFSTTVVLRNRVASR
jgi:type IV pilus assembly protein PilW